jgi:UDP-sugar transporter A1/2/3
LVNAVVLSLLGTAGGMLVALSIKYGNSILKILATTGSIILLATLDHFMLGGPLTAIMCIAGAQVVINICNYTVDSMPPNPPMQVTLLLEDEEMALLNSTQKLW